MPNLASEIDPVTIDAKRVVDDLIANGADLHYRAADGGLMASFTYELIGGGDRQKCRRLIAEAKARPDLWSAALREIASRTVEA